VDRLARLESALELLEERALTGADRAHQVQHLAALLALQRGGVEVADDLRDRLLDAEELVAEEVVDLDRFVLVEALHPGILAVEDVRRPLLHDDVVDAGVGELGVARVLTDAFEIFEKRALPELLLVGGAIVFDQFLKGALPVLHVYSFLAVPGARVVPRGPAGEREMPVRSLRKYISGEKA